MKNRKSNKSVASAPAPSSASVSHAGLSPAQAVMERVFREAETGNYEAALRQLKNPGGDPLLRNAVGVCLLRAGRAEEAIPLLRSLVMAPGSTWLRPEMPTSYKANFATALFLGGHPAGCWEVLGEINEPTHPTVQQLRRAMAQWELSLSMWQWLNWRMCRIAPSPSPRAVDFVPGDFGFRPTPVASPGRNEPDPPRSAA
ncbi:tetratricopeptide repeat protein [Lignipirellula cremea]|uniref:Tetratricopeptide repeat protein n=1 Tax=Lignipirellula cremea TaxID=2528010 RepID=A0A518E2V7_9BACT|nr:tetratricopeptide repeat protein [Lignipirellula cremea]QDU98429.1 hypothetical protein Pla8534_62970 [Lignipirellula cremea]